MLYDIYYVPFHLCFNFQKMSSQEEFKSYVTTQQIATTENALKWWKQNQFPRISRLAKAFLAIPATCVPSEQSFSKAGYITENRRTRLSSKHVNQILFLHFNSRFSATKLLEWDASSDDSDIECL